MVKPKIKDKAISDYVDELESRLSLYEKSPYVKTYLTLLNQLNDFNEQLTIKPEVEVSETRHKKVGEDLVPYEYKYKVTPGRIDMFGTKDEKEFERAFKYMSDVNKMLDNIENLRKKMSEEEKQEVTKVLKEDSVESRVFKKDVATT